MTVKRPSHRFRRERAQRALLGSCLLGMVACSGGPMPDAELLAIPAGPELLEGEHLGPAVVAGDTGPARFVGPLYEAFDRSRAMRDMGFIDQYYRAPANDGYEEVIELILRRLREAGYGSEEGFELEVIDTPLTAKGWNRGERVPARAWTPISGRLELTTEEGRKHLLHGFSAPGDRDRCMLPINTPSCDVEGPVATSLQDLDAGEIFLIEAAPTSTVLRRAQSRGAAAVVSSYLPTFNVDPSGLNRHLDACQFRSVPYPCEIPVVMISPRSRAILAEDLAEHESARLHLVAEVRWDERPLRTVVARVLGTDRAEEAVALVSHVQEPGAGDNASGVAGLTEAAVGLADLVRAGDLPRPSRTTVFVWGDEFRMSEIWLESTELEPVVGMSFDMTGQSPERTGSIALIERGPDPGAVMPMPPDRHTPWGQTEVEPGSYAPHGLHVVARCATLDVGSMSPGWKTADHPYEGGSDHDVFIAAGIPSLLFWHFTDFTYHTSIDRIEYVDPDELRRQTVAATATALAVADPRPEDLDRYLRSLNEEENVRVSAAESAEDADTVKLWKDWCYGARQWLRVECLRIPAEDQSPDAREAR